MACHRKAKRTPDKHHHIQITIQNMKTNTNDEKNGRQGIARPAMARISRIHQLLQNEEYPNTSKLILEFEVTKRTILRDIEYMRDQLRLPLEFDGKRNGFYYTRPVDYFPMLPMSEAEMFALFVAQKATEQYRGTPFESPLQNAFRRLTGQLDQNVKFTLGSVEEALSFHPFAPGDADLKAFELIRQGQMQKRVLKFLYRNHGAATTQRRELHPYHVACIQNQWYLIGFDVGRQALRTFALTRVTRAVLTTQKFTLAKQFNAQEYLAGSFSVFKGGEDHEVVVEFDAWAADEVRGRRWHGSQALTELPKGRLRMRMRLNNIEEVEKWVMSMGTHATVLQPPALRERLAAAGRELVRRYGEDGGVNN